MFEGLSVTQPGVLRIQVRNEAGALVAESHPLVVRDGRYGGYWADMHGQSGESIGITTSRQYFDFARNKAFLDATGHQANDFQVNNAFWAYLNKLTAEYHQDGTFVTLPGYATGTTPSFAGRSATRSPRHTAPAAIAMAVRVNQCMRVFP